MWLDNLVSHQLPGPNCTAFHGWEKVEDLFKMLRHVQEYELLEHFEAYNSWQ